MREREKEIREENKRKEIDTYISDREGERERERDQGNGEREKYYIEMRWIERERDKRGN